MDVICSVHQLHMHTVPSVIFTQVEVSHDTKIWWGHALLLQISVQINIIATAFGLNLNCHLSISFPITTLPGTVYQVFTVVKILNTSGYKLALPQ